MIVFSELAELIAHEDRQFPDAVAPLVRRIRAFDAKELLPTVREDTGRREGRLTVAGASVARVLSILVDFGFDSEVLAPVSAKLQAVIAPNGPSLIDVVIRQVRAGETVSLRLTLWVNSSEKWLGIGVDGIPRSARAKAAVDALSEDRGVKAQGSLELPLNDLLMPVIGHFDEDR